MSNIAQVIEALAKGKGVFKGDPLFLMADGQVVDKDGREVTPANALGAAAYTGHVGFLPADTTIPYEMLPFITEVDAVFAALPTIYVNGDFWVKQLAGADELYVATSGAWVASTDTFSEAAEVPAEPTDGDYYYATATSKLMKYVTDTWVEVTDHQYVRAASAPAFYADGYIAADQTTKKIYTKATSWGSGVSLAAGKLYTDGTDLYVFGSGSLAKI